MGLPVHRRQPPGSALPGRPRARGRRRGAHPPARRRARAEHRPQDAVNLGWKLAAEIQGWAPPGLLDSYHRERHAEGERVLLHTRAQGALVGAAADGRIAALREILAQLLQYQQPLRHLISLMYGLDTRYDTGTAGPHPLAGRWAPNLALTAPAGATSVAELLHSGRGVLLDLTPGGAF